MKKIISFLMAFFVFLPLTKAESNFSSAKTWAYQLENINLEELEKSDFDILVIDYSLDGTDEKAITKEEIQKLKDSGKTIIAYLSIGEAELVRFYWQTKWEKEIEKNRECIHRYYDWKKEKFTWENLCPYGKKGFIGAENPLKEGSYYIEYWQDSWWDIAIEPYLEKIIEADFDGIYLANVDSFDFWVDINRSSIRSSTNRMMNLVGKINNYLNEKNIDMILVAENGFKITRNCTKKNKARYLTWLDGVVLEDIFFEENYVSNFFNMVDIINLQKDGKKLLSVEYISTNKLADYLKRASKYNLEVLTYRANPNHLLGELIEQ